MALTYEWSPRAGLSRSGWLLIPATVHGGAVLVRRVAPRLTLALTLVTAMAHVALGPPVFTLGPAMLIVLYTVAGRLGSRDSILGLGAAVLTLLALLLGGPGDPEPDTILFVVGLVIGAWSLGEVVRRAREAAAAQASRLRSWNGLERT